MCYFPLHRWPPTRTSQNGDGTEIFSLPGIPAEQQGCGLLETVQTSPTVTKNITFSLGGVCPKSTVAGSTSLVSWSGSQPNPQPAACPASTYSMPRALVGSGIFVDMKGSLIIGAQNATIAQYEWAKHTNCGLNATELVPGDATQFQLAFGAVISGVDVLLDCWWVRVNPTGATLSLVFGSITGESDGVTRSTFPPRMGGRLQAGAVTCPASFDKAMTITGWVPA